MLEEIGIITLITFIILIILIPLIATIIIGITIANYLGLTGIVWWAFIILFYLIVSAILSKSNNN